MPRYSFGQSLGVPAWSSPRTPRQSFTAPRSETDYTISLLTTGIQVLSHHCVEVPVKVRAAVRNLSTASTTSSGTSIVSFQHGSRETCRQGYPVCRKGAKQRAKERADREGIGERAAEVGKGERERA